MNQQPQHPAPIGSAYGGGFYGGQIIINGLIFAIVWAPKSGGETKGKWLPGYDDVPAARSCFDSMLNTIAMAEAGSPIANWARGLQLGGHTDWCIPARDVLELGYRLLKPTTKKNYCSFRDGDNASSLPAGFPYTEDDPVQTEVSAFHDGGSEAFEAEWYWSSTQSSAGSAFSQGFNYGTQLIIGKSDEGRARAVRMIQLNP